MNTTYRTTMDTGLDVEVLPAHPAPATRRLPIRRLGSIEVPASGHWPLLSSSRLARSTGRRSTEQIHIRDGWLDLEDDPAQCWLHIRLDDRVVDLTPLAIEDDPFGLSVWHLHGVADDLHRRDPVVMTLRYHGVYRQGRDLFAWFTGAGVVEGESTGPRSTRRPAERLHLDLLLERPTR
ncbi:MAG: hypothetical protein AB7L17_13630 [Ilumatobacteraceae bacterium]